MSCGRGWGGFGRSGEPWTSFEEISDDCWVLFSLGDCEDLFVLFVGGRVDTLFVLEGQINLSPPKNILPGGVSMRSYVCYFYGNGCSVLIVACLTRKNKTAGSNQ